MAIRLRFHGAARTVTGSCYMIETDQARVLVDCGMFQGSRTERELNSRPFPFEAASLTSMILTHAHIDHAGLIPKLVKNGFKGKIYSTAPTIELCSVMLPDSGFIQETEVKHLNERNRQRGLPEVEPIYTKDDAYASLEAFAVVAYDTWMSPAAGIKARWWNAGHLLGSASIEVEVSEAGKAPLRLLFSGDIGPAFKMLEPDPRAPQGVDFVICESTYGGRDRPERSEEARRTVFAREVKAAAERGGALLIPSFAVERTQEIVTDLVLLMEQREVPETSIFIDSPLASKATAIFRKYARNLEHGDKLLRAFNSPLVKATENVEDSKALAHLAGFRVIVAASGMCDAGRIRNHLKNHLWQPSTTVLLAGFQAEGSLGRILQDGAKMVRIMGEDVSVKAAIRGMEDYSGHADGLELVAWVEQRRPIARTLFITHGEEESQKGLESDLKGIGIVGDCIVRPRLDDVYLLSSEGCALLAGEMKPRIDPTAVAARDVHNEATDLHLSIDEELRGLADERSRKTLIRSLSRVLEDARKREGR